MNIYDICTQEVITIEKNQTAEEAIHLMRDKHVGSLCIMDRLMPIGIVTDRDIVIKVLARTLDPQFLTVSDLMTGELLTLTSSTGIHDAIKKMAKWGVRRAPIIDEMKELVGIITLDDLLIYLSKEMHSLALLIQKEQSMEEYFIE